MSRFEILCVTMNQSDFSKIQKMNIHSDVVFANQNGSVSYEEMLFDNHKAKLVSTNTKGVGKNRNIALLYSSAEICLLADDDVRYVENLEEIILSEFDKNPKADAIVFNLNSTDKTRTQRKYNRTKRHHFYEKMPWGALRVAFRRKSLEKANVWFTPLFGGGCIFPSGEDSLFFKALKRAGFVFYVSEKTIGTVTFDNSSWFTGYDEKFYYGKGAFYQAVHPVTKRLWMIYFAIRTKGSSLSILSKLKWMNFGQRGYKEYKPYEEYVRGFIK